MTIRHAALSLAIVPALVPGLLAAEPSRSIGGVPAEDSPYCFVVYGDSRTGHEEHRRVVAAIGDARPRAVFHTGDLVADGDEPKEWEIFNSITADLRKKAEFFPSLGNHEEGARQYFDNFDLPGNERWYSVERGGVHVTVLDSNSSTKPGSEQHAWLSSDLGSARTPLLAVVMHHPPFSSGSHAGEGGRLAKEVVPIFERYGVDVVFAGHDHDYERLVVNGVTYVVTGGGGAPVHGQREKHPASRVFAKAHHFVEVCVQGGGMDVQAVDLDGKVLDGFSVKMKLRPPPVEPGRPVNCCGH